VEHTGAKCRTGLQEQHPKLTSQHCIFSETPHPNRLVAQQDFTSKTSKGEIVRCLKETLVDDGGEEDLVGVLILHVRIPCKERPVAVSSPSEISTTEQTGGEENKSYLPLA
jgi:hypothetical protein